MKRLLLTGVFIVLLLPLAAQEMLGPSFSNYAGQMGISYNPATIVGMPHRWEINLLSGDFAVQNNFMRLRRNSRWLRKSLQGETISEDRVDDSYTTSDKWMYSSSFLKYPSFVWSGKKFALAASLSTRAEASAREIPHHLAKFMKEGFDYDPLQDRDWTAEDGRLAILNWHELSLTGGMVLWDDVTHYWAGAVTLNYNYGLNGLYMDIGEMRYNSISDTLLVVYNLDAEFGYAMPLDADPASSIFKKKGSGTSMSAGIRYFHNRNDDYYNPCRKGVKEKPYDYRVGIALNDLGHVSFNRQSSTVNIRNANSLWYGIDTVKFNSIENLDSLLGLQFAGNPVAYKSGTAFTIYTPTALNLDIDIPLKSWLFINASVVQRIPVGKYQVKRMNQFGFTPRVEFRRFEFALPFSLYEYTRPRLGASLRVGAFTLGTDMLSPLIGVTDAYGADLYFGITLRNFGDCGRSKSGGRKPRSEKCNTPGS